MAFLLPRTFRLAASRSCTNAPLKRSLSSLPSITPKTLHPTSTPNAWRTYLAARTPWRRSSSLVAPLQHSSNFFTSAFAPSSLTAPSSTIPDSPAPTIDSQLPPLSGPAVTRWLFLSASLVFAIVVVGGVTRLTESGLSIVEWRPIAGTLPPLSHAEWQEEFEKYQTSPEFKT